MKAGQYLWNSKASPCICVRMFVLLLGLSISICTNGSSLEPAPTTKDGVWINWWFPEITPSRGYWFTVEQMCADVVAYKKSTLPELFRDAYNAEGGACSIIAPHYFGVDRQNVLTWNGIQVCYVSESTNLGEYVGTLHNVKCLSCPSDGFDLDSGARRCVANGQPQSAKEPRSCPRVGNPINPLSGNKYQQEADYRGSGSVPLVFERYYNSDNSIESFHLGSHWRHTYERSISLNESVNAVTANIYRADGRWFFFNESGDTWIPDVDITSQLVTLRNERGSAIGWQLAATGDTIEIYDNEGKLRTIISRTGHTQVLTYDVNGNLDSVTDNHGRSFVFTYDALSRLATVTVPEGNVYNYRYDAKNNLVSVIYPDDTPNDISDNPVRQYHYGEPNFPHALTGITDENGNRFATWTYDSEGRAISSEHANGVDKTTLTHNADGTTTVTNPLGKQTTYHFTTIHGVRKVTQVEGHPTTSCEGANKAYSYDANGNVISKTDWNGVTTNYTYDMDRNLELSRTEAAGTPRADHNHRVASPVQVAHQDYTTRKNHRIHLRCQRAPPVQ